MNPLIESLSGVMGTPVPITLIGTSGNERQKQKGIRWSRFFRSPFYVETGEMLQLESEKNWAFSSAPPILVLSGAARALPNAP